MTTTTTPAVAGIIPAEQLEWSRADWIDAFQDGGETYASSVLWAADEAFCCLSWADLARLLREHGQTVENLEDELAEALEAGAPVLPLAHADQALAWLGY